jgi:hypothetical protein
MTGTIGQQGKMKFATKLLPNWFWGVRYVVERIGGPDRDRTDDLFHAMVRVLRQTIDGTVLMNRHNRQKRPNGRYLRAKCGQNFQPSGQRAGRVDPAQQFSSCSRF